MIKRKRRIEVGDQWSALNERFDFPIKDYKHWFFVVVGEIKSEDKRLFVATKIGVEFGTENTWMFDEWGREVTGNPDSCQFYFVRKCRPRKDCWQAWGSFWLGTKGVVGCPTIDRWEVAGAPTP